MIIAMPVYPSVDMLDVTGPYEMFGWAGITVELLAEKPGMISFRNGFSFEVKTSFDKAGAYDAIWVPGGDPEAGLKPILTDKHRVYLDFLVRQAPQAKYTCSVCEGALLLAAAGLLDGYEATTHWAFIPWLIENFPKVKVVDGHPRFHLDRDRLTGGGISSGLDEALKLIELLLGTAAAQGAQQATQYYPQPPVSSAIPNVISSPMPRDALPNPAGPEGATHSPKATVTD